MADRFIFNPDHCLGCHACVMACAIENKTPPDLRWRQVIPYNPQQHRKASVFYLSMSCNHCENPACLSECPANAYSIHQTTGAVVHDQDLCMGCKYCSWVCPFDAPKYNPIKKTMEKCSLCQDRLLNKLAPACAVSCPTGALKFDDPGPIHTEHHLPGFPKTNLNPSIEILPIRLSAPEFSSPPVEAKLDPLADLPESKLSVVTEWPLAAFTLIAAAQFAYMSGSVYVGFRVNPLLFLISSFAAFSLSLFHLGKKARAFHSFYNVKSSWLSREIILFSLFTMFSLAHLFSFPFQTTLGYLGLLAGGAGLISMDRVYKDVDCLGMFNLNSSHLILTGLLLAGIVCNSAPLISLIAFIKLVLYIQRFVNNKKNVFVFSLIRIFAGLLIPLAFSLAEATEIPFYVLLLTFCGELIDRCEYYNNLDVASPQKQMALDLNSFLKT